jgi:predicted ATP-grasp superfamily ATP-dependent carboligase
MAMRRNGRGAGGVVLMGFAEAYAAIETAWSLQAAGFTVHAFTRAGEKPALRRVRRVVLHEVGAPETDVRQTAADLRTLIQALRPVAYLPLDDGAVWLTSEIDRAGVLVAGPTGAAVDFALNKNLQIEAARAAGLSVPATRVVDSTIAVDVEASEYPVVVKPARALYEHDGRLIRPTGKVAADQQELASIFDGELYPPLLLQPLVRGTGEGLFGHATENGVVGWSAHRRIRMLNPQGSASSACASHPVDEALIGPAERFLAEIGWRGLFMLEFLRDRAGTPWFMELNGRAWGSLALARRRGFEYPAWTVGAALDDRYAPLVPQHPPAVVCRHLGMELVHLAFVLRGPSSSALEEWPAVWPTVRALARFRRGDRLYNWKASQPDVLIADTAKMLRVFLGKAFRSGS